MNHDVFAICEKFEEDEYGEEWFPESNEFWFEDMGEAVKRLEMFRAMGNTQKLAVCMASMTPWSPIHA